VALTCAPAAFAQTEVSTDTATATARAIGEAAGKIESTTVTRESKTVSKITAAEGFYHVVMKGHFVYNAGSPPKGYKSPEGDELEVLVNRETGDVRELHIGGEPPASTTAETARRKRARAKDASWGPKPCTEYGSHCYAVATWYMTGSEQVEGDVVNVNTSNMNVPEWASQAFVTNETWVDFHPSGYWLEIGTHGGHGLDCCSLRWFYAYKNASGYHEVDTVGGIPPNVWAWYWIQAIGSGTWCWKIGEHGEATVECQGGFPTYSNELQDGAEAASETEPTNAGKVVASYQSLGGTWKTWNKATNEHDVKMCISQYESYPGNINYGTC